MVAIQAIDQLTTSTAATATSAAATPFLSVGWIQTRETGVCENTAYRIFRRQSLSMFVTKFGHAF